MSGTFPTTPRPTTVYPISIEFDTIEGGPYRAGGIVAHDGRAYELYGVEAQWSRRDRASLMGIWEFFRQQKGRGGRFAFIDFAGWNASPVGWDWTKLYCCVATAGQTVVPLPSTNGSSFTLYKNDVAVSGGAWTLGTGGIHASADQATFGAGLTAGDIITASFRGQRTMYARFLEKKLRAEWSGTDLLALALTIVEDRTE